MKLIKKWLMCTFKLLFTNMENSNGEVTCVAHGKCIYRGSELCDTCKRNWREPIKSYYKETIKERDNAI